VEFKQNRKHEKDFHQLTVGDLQDIFAIQQKLLAQMVSLEIDEKDLTNQNWAEFEQMEQAESIPTTQKQREDIRLRAERGSRSRSHKRNNLLDI